MKRAFLLLALAGCATEPKVTVSPIIASEAPKPEPKPVEHNLCAGPTSQVSIRRDTPRSVEMRRGDTSPFSWTVTVGCGAIELRGMMVSIRMPGGRSESRAIPLAMPIILMTGNHRSISFDYDIPPEMPAGTYFLTVRPLWIDSFTLRLISGADEPENASVDIRVQDEQNL